MLKVTKLDGRKILISPESIKYIEETPDTLIQFLNGESVLIKESLDDVSKLDEAFRQQLLHVQDRSHEKVL
jgi:flagellar protein FlbD